MILPFLVCLFILIVVHELSHFLAARLVGCDVETVSIGFWKPILWSKKIGKTTYQLTPWLIGGYCKLKGELEYTQEKNTFSNLRYMQKVILVSAGCAANIIVGIMGIIVGRMLDNYNIFLFGYLGLALGIGNMIPFPALDGSYLWLFGLEKIYGKQKAYPIMQKIVQWGFIIIMALNFACIPYFIQMMRG